MRMARSLSRSSKSDSLSETHGDPNTQPGRWPLGKFSLRADLSLRTTRFLMQCWPHAFISYPQSLGKTLMLGKVEGRKTRGWQDEMVGWRHRLDGHEFEQALGVGDGQGILACCSPWGHKESDTTERLNWTEASNKIYLKVKKDNWRWNVLCGSLGLFF